MALILNSLDLPHLNGDERLWVYNAMDTMVMPEIYGEIRPRLDPNTTGRIYKFEKAMLGPALTMMRRGLKVDIPLRDAMFRTAEDLHFNLSGMRRINKKATVVNEAAPFQRLARAAWGDVLNYNSPIAVQKVLYEHMRIPIQFKLVKGQRKVSTDRETLEKIAIDYPRCAALVYAILQLRDQDKVLQVLDGELSPDGRMHFGFNVAGTETGRWSSRSHVIWDAGQFQNITKDLRNIFIPDDGYVMIYPDLEQAESRAVAYISEDEAYIKACEGGDLHTVVAKMTWPGLEWTDDIAADKKAVAEQLFYRQFTYRDMAKRGGHGSNYYGMARTMARHLKVEEKVMHRFQASYLGGELKKDDIERWGYYDLLKAPGTHVDGGIVRLDGAFPGIRRWHERTIQRIQTDGELTTALGRKRTFYGRGNDPSTWREAIAFEPQSLIGEVMNLGLFRTWKKHDPQDCMLLGQVHDAVVGQVPEDTAHKSLPEIVKTLTVPIEVHGRTMTIPIEMQVGRNWKDMQKVKDPSSWTL